MRGKLLSLFFLTMTLLLVNAPVGNAAFIQGSSGNTNLKLGTLVDGTVNFAVLTNTGIVGDRFGTGFATFDTTFTPGVDGDTSLPSAVFDTTAKYLYLYMITNNTNIPPPASSTSFIGSNSTSLANGKTGITSFGAFAGVVFSDNLGQVRATPLPSGNVFGTIGVFGNNATGVPSAAEANTGVTTPSVVAATVGSGGTPHLPSTVSLTDGSPGSFRADFIIGNRILNGERSTLYGFTSNLPPIFALTSIQDGGGTANRTAVAHSPEPSQLVLGAIGVPFLLLFWRWKMGR